MEKKWMQCGHDGVGNMYEWHIFYSAYDMWSECSRNGFPNFGQNQRVA